MSDSARHSLFAIVEATYGITPDNPEWKTIRHTGTSLATSKGSLLSEELRADRQIVDFRHGNQQIGGDLNHEISYGTLDSFFEAVTGGTFAVKATKTGTTISAAAADNSFNDSGNGFVAAGFEVGDEVTVSGFTGNIVNNIAKGIITAVAAGKITIGGADGDVIVDDAAGEAVTIATTSYRLKAGVTRRSFSFLRYFSDQLEADEPYHIYKGVELNTLNLSIGLELITAAFGTLGVKEGEPSGTAPAGSTYVAANSNAVMDSFTGSIKEGGTSIATITEVSATLENGIAPRFTIGSDAAQLRASIGRSNLTGQLSAYFENSALKKKFLNQTESSIDVTIRSAAGAYRFYFPRIKYTGGQADTDGQGPITSAMPFQAMMHATLGTNLIIDRLPA